MSQQPTASGRFVWHDLISTDPDASQAFYSALFGWDIQDVPMEGIGTYRMISAAGEGQGGIEPVAQEGIPSHWLAYVTVDDVDAAATAAKDTGGTIHLEPTDIPNIGRFSIIADPSGAIIAPFRSTNAAQPETEPKPSQFCWDELLSTNAEACGPFYSNLLPWRQESMTMPTGPDGGEFTYHLFKRGSEGDGTKDGAGMLPMPAEAGVPSHWLPYILVEDVDASCEKAQSLGATVYKAPDDIPNVGRFAVLGDPQGASFAVYKSAEQHM